MEEGNEYVFERINNSFSIKEGKSREVYISENETFKIKIEKNTPDSLIIFTYKFLESYEEGTARKGVINRTDRFFPAFNETQTTLTHAQDFIKSILSRSVFRFSINHKTKEIELLNRVELLEEFHLRLVEQGNTNREIENAINYLNRERLFISEEQLSFLTLFHNTKISDGRIVHQNKSGEKYIINERNGEFIKFGDQNFDNVVSGKEYQKYWINIENGLITNYSTIQYDSIKSNNIQFRLNKRIWRVKETDFRLLYSQRVPQKTIFISGEIENPLSNKIHVRILDKPFGTDLKTKTLILDENGSFSANINYCHEGFVYVENENNNKFNPPATYVFYAEPGDTIRFDSKGMQMPWKTTFSGIRKTEAELIQELREKINIAKDSRISGTSKKILDYEPIFGISIVNGEAKLVGEIEPIFNAIKNLEQIAKNYEPQISEMAFSFITNEIKAYFLGGIFDFGSKIIRRQDLSLREIPRENDYQNLLSQIDLIDVHEVYNNYGLHSRKCINHYLNYHFTKANKIKTRYITSYGFHFMPGTEMKIQFSRMVLSGSPLYREIANALSEILIEDKSKIYLVRKVQLSDFAINNFNLLIRLCNDLELVNEIKNIIKQHEKLQNDTYLPELEFVNRKDQTVIFNDFKGDKPSIFYFSSNWIGGRYQFDELVTEHPEINFIMIVEGSNFKQWEDYTKAADPKATHLLYYNDSSSFSDIFQRNTTHLVFNKSGEFEEYASSTKDAIQKAKASLQPKKIELNKSQLELIIILLGVVLALFIIGLVIWKWRVRQRFRKEAQIRKLRELELTAIRSQMNPHFLFNSLNSVQNLVQQNKGREAHLYLADFAGLIRKVLQNSEKEEVSLAEELEMTEQYLNLEKLRFDFDFKISVNENIDANNTMVPAILLQPFAENAVIHGLQSKPENRRLIIDILKESTGIKVIIEDNGIGRDAAKKIAKTKNGKGSKMIQERLKILQEKQGEKYSLEIIDLSGEKAGTRVEIFIPEEK
ncbi:MAG: histidine kinase [Prolixibacteraceae bacterium]|nr:histidine kinase [Prolixibacteraceae bacterium]